MWVSSEAKAGKDAAELAGLDGSTGITATNDLDAVLATDPECAVYTALADNRLPDALEDYRRILSAGVNVVGSSAVFLQYPWQVIPEELLKPIEDAAQAGKSSLFVNGIDPGFANDLLPLALAGTCQSIEQIRCMEIINYDTYDSADVMFDVMGFGKPLDEIPMLLQPGVLSLAWGSVVRQLAAGLGISLDEVTRPTSANPRPRTSTSRPGTSRRAPPRHCASRCAAWSTARPPSSSSTSPGCATTCARTGRNRPRRAARIASRSPANRRTRWTSASAARNGDHNHAGLVATAATGRQRHPRRGGRSARNQDHARLTSDNWEWAVRWQ